MNSVYSLICSHSSRKGLCRLFPLVSCFHINGAPLKREPLAPIPGRLPTIATTGEQAFGELKDGAKVFIQGSCATPTLLVNELYKYVMNKGIQNVQIFNVYALGQFPFGNSECAGHFRTNSFFVGKYCLVNIINKLFLT